MSQPSRDVFLEQVAKLVVARFPLVKLEQDTSQFALRLNGHWASLENLYRSAAEATNDLPHYVERWAVEILRAADAVPSATTTLDEVRERVMPVVLTTVPPHSASDSMVRQPVVAGLDVAYAIDADRSIAYIPQQMVDLWKVPLEELHELAIDNLIKRSEQIQAYADADDSGTVQVIVIQTLDGYDATRLLLPTLNERLREHLGSPFVAAIPNRDALICFRNEASAVARLRVQVEDSYRTMPHQVTDKLFLVTADGIAPYSE